jgi:hypothetical protein
MPSRKKKPVGKKPKVTLSSLLAKKRKKGDNIATMKVKPFKKKGKKKKVTSSSITNHKQILNEMNEFIYSLAEPYTRESFLASLNTYKSQLATNKKVNNRIKFPLMRELEKMEDILSNLQDEKLIEWITNYQREKSNPNNHQNRIVYDDFGVEIGVKVQDVQQALRNLTQSSLETDTKNLIEAGLYMLPMIEEYQGVDMATDENLLKKMKDLLLNVRDSIGNEAKKEMVNFLTTNPEKFIDVILWISENLGGDDEEVWEFVEKLIPFTTVKTLPSLYNPSGKRVKTSYRWIDNEGQQKSTDIYSSVRIRRMNFSVSLKSLISELARAENLNRLLLLTDDSLKKIQDSTEDILNEARIPLEQAKAIVDLNSRSTLFRDIVMFKQLTKGFSNKPHGEVEVELHSNIARQLDSINFDHDTIISDKATITVVRITDVEDEDKVYAAFVAAPGREPQSTGVRTGQDVGKRHDRGIGVDTHGRIIRKMNLLQYAWIPSSVAELEEIPMHEMYNQEKKDMMESIVRAIRGYMGTVLHKFLWQPSNNNSYFVRVFREHYVQTFVEEFVNQAITSSQTIGDVLNKVAEFTIFFHMDPVPENRKNLFIITNITGSLNGRESGEYFRTSVLNRRLTPQSILENPIENKLPIIFHATNNVDEMRDVLNSGIQKEKQDIIISIFMILDPMKVQDLRGGFQEDEHIRAWASKSHLAIAPVIGDKWNSFGVVLPDKGVATATTSKKVITHRSCNNKNENSVLYIETVVDPTTNQGVKNVYCFDLLKLYEKLMKNNTKNHYSGIEFRDDFIRDIRTSMTDGVKKLEDSNNMVNVEKQKASSITAIQQWFRNIQDKKPVKWDTNSRWAINFLLNIPDVQSEIERLEEIEKTANETVYEKEMKIVSDMITKEELRAAALEKQAAEFKNKNDGKLDDIEEDEDLNDEEEDLNIDEGEEDSETWKDEEEIESDSDSDNDEEELDIIEEDNSDEEELDIIEEDNSDEESSTDFSMSKNNTCHHCKKQCKNGVKTVIDNNGITHVDVCIPCFEHVTL